MKLVQLTFKTSTRQYGISPTDDNYISLPVVLLSPWSIVNSLRTIQCLPVSILRCPLSRILYCNFMILRRNKPTMYIASYNDDDADDDDDDDTTMVMVMVMAMKVRQKFLDDFKNPVLFYALEGNVFQIVKLQALKTFLQFGKKSLEEE
ncbi:hypothetical protein V1478_006095 [Vespula squamosa]|uniref:Uncharacterized protein n=1 Tax=Vespula squamosa TaxID=30214 RepID=A0ABD2B796_VESSQ